MTHQTRTVLQAFLDAPGEETYGYALTKASGVKAGSLYPILDRLVIEGWIEGRWEELDEHAEGRRRRRYYHLTADGARNARAAVHNDSTALRGLMPGWAR